MPKWHHVISVDLERVVHRVLPRCEVPHLKGGLGLGLGLADPTTTQTPTLT